MGRVAFLTTRQGRRIAYCKTEGAGPGVVFLGGFKSDMEGTKARISSGMRSRHKADQQYRKQQVMRSNLMLAGVLLMLLVLGYLLLNVYLPELNQFME